MSFLPFRLTPAAVAVLIFSLVYTSQIARAQPTNAMPPDAAAAEASISADRIRAHDRFLADDLLEGRAPGLRGGDLAAKYIATQFALDGLAPAGDNGTYLQQVSFFGMTVRPDATTFSLVPASGAPIPLHFGADYVVFNPRHTPTVDIDAPIVFAGYGATAPEYQWDDYAGTDVKGKVVLIIVGDPPSNDPAFFAGKTLTYYGRWTYKLEQAGRQGAIGALIIHRTDLASYPWAVVQNSNSGERTFLADDKNPQVAAASWINHDIADKLFSAVGLPPTDAEIDAAGKRGFHAIPLSVRLKAHIESTVRPYQSPNVVAKLPGASASPDHAVLYTAHYDHLGLAATPNNGDSVYNGAVDNATGCAILLELARAWSTLKTPPPHSVYFASVTAEEQGLLGSEYLGQHPPMPASQIALDLNYDAIQPFGDPLEVNVDGAERTTFFPTVQQTAQRFHLAIVTTSHPEAGEYYRSDHFSLARVGIPSFSIGEGTLYAGHDAAWGLARDDDYTAHRYHTVFDNYTPDMDFTGNAKVARFGFDLGWQAISAPGSITWHPGDEFLPARQHSQSH
jgi:Zn-dependent M28 family amino/carboxypeptidase